MLRRIEQGDAAAEALSLLSMEKPQSGLASPEATAESVRRAASFLCPCSRRDLVDPVFSALRGLCANLERSDVDEALTGLINAGDLIEAQATGEPSRMLYLGPPTFVEKPGGAFLLLGVRPDAVPLVDSSAVGADLEHDGYMRSVTLDPSDGKRRLKAEGLHQMKAKQWARMPNQVSADELLTDAQKRLAAASTAGLIPGLEVIDPESKVSYYAGRWREIRASDSGIYVARRSTRFGERVWSVANVVDGIVDAVVDFPFEPSAAPGSDGGLRFQAALDAARDFPQRFRVGQSPRNDEWTLDLFSPIPSWADRWLLLEGVKTDRSQGALMSYAFPDTARTVISSFLSTHLWMREA